MRTKTISGIVTAVVGIVLIGFSFYIKGEVAQGRAQISQGERQVEQGNKLFSLTPITKEVGKELTGSAERKIDEGKATANQYESMAFWMQIGGAVFVVLGVGVLFIGKKKQQ